jgi:hypothetical protein
VKVNTPRPNSHAGFDAILPRFGERRARSLREAQSELQQFVPHVAFDKTFDHAIDARCVHEHSFDLRRGETLRVTLDQVLA